MGSNCGTTFFAIQFQGVNDQGFGDYADGWTQPQALDTGRGGAPHAPPPLRENRFHRGR